MSVLRKATDEDAPGVADVYLRSRRQHVGFAPLAHSETDVRAWIACELIPSGCVFVIEEARVIAGMIALAVREGRSWIDQLYVAPERTGRGIGSRLIEFAKKNLEAPIYAYTFQENHGARRFYERHGFHPIRVTDGAENEERCPDVLYRLDRRPNQSPEPTVMSVTPRADARVAPAMTVAHL